MEQRAYRTPAWLLVGMTGSAPGVLEDDPGRWLTDIVRHATIRAG